MVSQKRDLVAARRFFTQAVDSVGHESERLTSGGHDDYPRAVLETLGDDVTHRTNRHLNNRLEQDHRGLKQRYYSLRGFGSFESASRFCQAFDEVRYLFRPRNRFGETVSLAAQRQLFRVRFDALITTLTAA